MIEQLDGLRINRASLPASAGLTKTPPCSLWEPCDARKQPRGRGPSGGRRGSLRTSLHLHRSSICSRKNSLCREGNSVRLDRNSLRGNRNSPQPNRNSLCRKGSFSCADWPSLHPRGNSLCHNRNPIQRNRKPLEPSAPASDAARPLPLSKSPSLPLFPCPQPPSPGMASRATR